MLDQVLYETDASCDKDLIFTFFIGGKLAHIGTYLVTIYFKKNLQHRIEHEYIYNIIK